MMPDARARSTTAVRRSPLAEQVRLSERVDGALQGFLATECGQLRRLGDELIPVAEIAGDLLAAGKRVRPAFCYWGWRAAGGADGDEIVTAAASLELLHGCALVHDDVMDGSDTRRGRPAAHRRFGALHRGHGWPGDPAVFGRSGAILLGDLLLVWGDRMLAGCGLSAEAVRRAWSAYDDMRVELMAGQYLDLLEQARGGQDVDAALRVARLKTAKYTVERPLQVGALLAGASDAQVAACTAYGIPLGEAFQLRDDLLGVFGDPAETGKPAGDDLREGKRTALVALALRHSTPTQERALTAGLRAPDLDAAGVDRLRDVIAATGAAAAVEDLIGRRVREAVAAVRRAPFDPDAVEALVALADTATARRS